jgi:hypothetical protein
MNSLLQGIIESERLTAGSLRSGRIYRTSRKPVIYSKQDESPAVQLKELIIVLPLEIQ